MKKPYINPAFYVLAFLVTGVFVYALIVGLNTEYLMQRIIYISGMCFIVLYFAYYLLKPFHPVEMTKTHVILKRYYAKNIIIPFNQITQIEHAPRFDVLTIQTKHKTYRISFLLETDELIKAIKKNMPSK